MQRGSPVATQTHRGLWNPVIACLKALVNYRVSAPICPAGMSPDTERFLLENGKEWPWKRERLPSGVRPGPVRHCYLNAASAALSQSKLVYVEGWACTHLYRPVGHAWCIHRETLSVVDPTWESNHRDRIYFGIAFKTSFLRQFKESSPVELSILGWSEADWPVQTGRIPRKVWAFEAEP